MGQQRAVSVTGAELRIQTFGERAAPAILLLPGLDPSIDGWDEQLCTRLAAGGRFVIRYGGPDTGGPTSIPMGDPGGADVDRIRDAVSVLDTLGCGAAHVVGAAAGGVTAIWLTLLHPDRVLTLTLIDGGADSGAADLPTRRMNQARFGGGGRWRDRLGEIAVPTLIISADDDRSARDGFGVELAAGVSAALHLVVPTSESIIAQRVWDVVVPAVLRLTSPNWQIRADVLAERAIAADDATGWFDKLYGAAARGAVSMPWDRDAPQPQLVEWFERRAGGSKTSTPTDAAARRAVVVGCGLGADAEYLSRLGFRTTAFDVSPTAISIARSRHRASSVAYSVQDLFDLPVQWSEAFDLVVEIYTVQALPLSLRQRAIAAVAGLVAPGGTAVVIQAVRDESERDPEGPPWPLTRTELESFADEGLSTVRIERLLDGASAARWRAEFTRPRGT